jgi:antimicrobial peptide system SdpA family protein
MSASNKIGKSWLSPTGLGALFLLHWLLLSGLIIVAALAAMPFNTLAIPDHIRGRVMTFLPEGWGFFTKNPRDPEMQVAILRDGTLHQLNIGSSFQARYAFGFSRNPRGQGLEIDELLEQLRDSRLWHSCQHATNSCAEALAPQKRILNSVRKATFCGDLILFERGPVPWAYRKTQPTMNMPSRLTRVEVICSRG